MVIVGPGFLGGKGERRCLEGGRGGSDGRPEGGPAGDPGGVEGGFPPCPAVGSGAGGLGDMWRLSCSNRCLISGVVGSAGGPVVGALFPGSDVADFPTLVVSGLMGYWCWSAGWGFSMWVVLLALGAL